MATARPKPERGRLELQEIKRLIEMIERSPITEFELVDKDLRIRISKNGKEAAPVHVTATPALATFPPYRWLRCLRLMDKRQQPLLRRRL